MDSNSGVPTALPPSSTQLREANMGKIEAIFERFAEDLINGEDSISITLRNRGVTLGLEDERFRRVTFPGKSAEEAWCFAVVVRILEMMHEALRTDVILSKRDIYYRDPALFGGQAPVDRYVDDIVCTFQVSRASMNVSAAAKGLIAGAITICRRDGSLSAIDSESDGFLVPSLREILSVDISTAKWVLVIEKEATFRAFACSRFWKTRTNKGIIITGKGYPDIATRALLRLLCTPSPWNGYASLQVFGLVDFDPDGLAILATYQDGSKALAHESHELRVPSIRWLGLHSQHLQTGEASTHTCQGLLTLSSRDRRRAKTLLERPISLTNKCKTVTWQSQLQHMLMLNLKAELQLLQATDDDLIDLLRQEIEPTSSSTTLCT